MNSGKSGHLLLYACVLDGPLIDHAAVPRVRACDSLFSLWKTSKEVSERYCNGIFYPLSLSLARPLGKYVILLIASKADVFTARERSKMKVYCIYDGKNVKGEVVNRMAESFKLKIDIPASWREGPCERLLTFFLRTLKAKRDVDVAADEVVMQCSGLVIRLRDSIGSCVSDYNDIVILHKIPEKVEGTHEGELKCTNFGCNEYYKEEENTDNSCHYHSKGPVFHDLEKHWGCCEGKKAFDWESFEQIPKCCVGRHSTSNKPFVFPKEEVLNIPLSASQVAQASAASSGMHDGKRTTGPREFEGAAFAQTQPQEIVDGKARCRNFGCAKEFVVAENTKSSCRYHKEGPVFWDTYKYWKCCPDKKCLEFDDFVKVPGCCEGAHKL